MPLNFIINFQIIFLCAVFFNKGWRSIKFDRKIIGMSRKVKDKKNYRMYNETLY